MLFLHAIAENYKMPKVETKQASAVSYEDDAHIFFVRKISSKLLHVGSGVVRIGRCISWPDVVKGPVFSLY